MKQTPYQLERRTNALAKAIPKAIDSMAAWMTPPGRRPPFTTQLSRNSALDWWESNISKPAGQQAYALLDSVSQVELQRSLTERVTAKQMMGVGNAQPEASSGYPVRQS